MKKLITKDRNGKYRIIKADVPYTILSNAIGKAIYEVVHALGIYQDLEDQKRLIQLPFAIGERIIIKMNTIPCTLEIEKVIFTGKDIELICVNEEGLEISIPQKVWENYVKELV